MAATAPPEESLSSGQSGNPVRPHTFPQPLQSYQQQEQQQQLQLVYPVTTRSYPLHPFPTQLGPQRVFYEPMVRGSLQTLHVDYPPMQNRQSGRHVAPLSVQFVSPPTQFVSPPTQFVAPPTQGRARVAPPYMPPPPYPQYGSTHPSPPQPSTSAPARLPPRKSNNLCCHKIVKTIIILAIISLIVSLCYYLFHLKKKH